MVKRGGGWREGPRTVTSADPSYTRLMAPGRWVSVALSLACGEHVSVQSTLAVPRSLCMCRIVPPPFHGSRQHWVCQRRSALGFGCLEALLKGRMCAFQLCRTHRNGHDAHVCVLTPCILYRVVRQELLHTPCLQRPPPPRARVCPYALCPVRRESSPPIHSRY